MYVLADVTPLTIESVHSNAVVEVFPNPTSHYLNIGTPENQIKRIVLYDITGKELLSRNTKLKKVDMSLYPKGLYLLEIEFFDVASVRTKIIKD